MRDRNKLRITLDTSNNKHNGAESLRRKSGRNVRSRSLGDYFFYFFLVDILFLPFPPGLPVTYSVLILPLWMLVEFKKKQKPGDIVKMVIACVLVIASFAYALVVDSIVDMQGSIVNSGLVGYMFVVYLLCSSYLRGSAANIVLFLKVYILFVASFAIVFVISPAEYFSLRGFWTASGRVIEVEDLTSLTRFTGTLSDPNNVAIISCAVLAFICFRDPRNITVNLILFASTAVIVTSAMSVSGFIVFAAVALFYFLTVDMTSKRSLNVLLRVLLLGAVAGLVVGTFVVIQDNLVVQLAIDRAENSSVYSRFSRWLIIFDLEKIFTSILIGDGGVISWRGSSYRPHNGHFHVFFSFGLIVYLLFISIFLNIKKLRYWKQYFFVLPIFFGFTVNVGIYEPRFAGVWVLLIASYHVRVQSEAMGLKR